MEIKTFEARYELVEFDYYPSSKVIKDFRTIRGGEGYGTN